MTLGLLGFWALVAVVTVALLRRPGPLHQQLPPDQRPRPNPEQVLAQRLARGELDPEEYRQRLQAFHEPPTGMTRATSGAHPGCRVPVQPLSLVRSSGRSASCCWTMGPSIGS